VLVKVASSLGFFTTAIPDIKQRKSKDERKKVDNLRQPQAFKTHAYELRSSSKKSGVPDLPRLSDLTQSQQRLVDNQPSSFSSQPLTTASSSLFHHLASSSICPNYTTGFKST
jgi:hypothetical protein